MPRKKKLKTNGNSIESYEVVVNKVKSSHSDADIDVVLLRVSTSDGEFRYQICRDTRAPDINQIKTHIEQAKATGRSDEMTWRMRMGSA